MRAASAASASLELARRKGSVSVVFSRAVASTLAPRPTTLAASVGFMRAASAASASPRTRQGEGIRFRCVLQSRSQHTRSAPGHLGGVGGVHARGKSLKRVPQVCQRVEIRFIQVFRRIGQTIRCFVRARSEVGFEHRVQPDCRVQTSGVMSERALQRIRGRHPIVGDSPSDILVGWFEFAEFPEGLPLVGGRCEVFGYPNGSLK